MGTSDWERSADAWVAHLGARGDRGREFVIDPTLEEWLAGRGFKRALDVGCGEGRLCRWLSEQGVQAIGIDPTERLIEVARQRDPKGTYQIARAEALPFDDGEFDLVITCLSLIDIPDFRAAIDAMARVLVPGGTLVAVNLTSFSSAGEGVGWKRGAMGAYKHFALDHYLKARGTVVRFSGIEIVNYHRPLSAYMQAYLGAGLQLKRFDEPKALAKAPTDFVDRYNRAPWFNFMEWQKPV